jgi:hypothetical protein
MLMHNQQLNNELTRQGVLYNNVPTSVSTGTEMLLWILMPVGLILIMWTMMRRSSDPFSSGGMMGDSFAVRRDDSKRANIRRL